MEPRRLLIAAAVLAVCHLLWLLDHLAPAVLSPDAHGYLLAGRLLATTGGTALHLDSPVQFQGTHWFEVAEGTFRSEYPPGLPVLLAGAWSLGGLQAAVLVNPLLASAAVFLTFLLARRFVGGPGALVAAAVVAAARFPNEHALAGDAHAAATFFLLAGVLAALRFADTGSPAAGVGAGLLLGAVPAMHYPEGLPAALALGWIAWRKGREAWPALAAALLPAGLLMAYNTTAFGAPWITGYALSPWHVVMPDAPTFTWDAFVRNGAAYVQGLSAEGFGLFFGLGLAGLAAALADPRSRSEAVLAALASVPTIALYLFYERGSPDDQRFFISALPYFAVAGVWLTARIGGRPGAAALAVVAAVQILVSLSDSGQALQQARTSLSAAAGVRELAAARVPPGSVLITEAPLAESLDPQGRWRLVYQGFLLGGSTLYPTEGRPAPPPVPGSRSFMQRFGRVDDAARRSRVWAAVLEWAGGEPLYWLADSRQTVQGFLPPGATCEELGLAERPEPLGEPTGRPGAPLHLFRVTVPAQ